MNYLDLPVYRHKYLILKALSEHQVIVVESPTGSGKTTQMPIILHEAGFARNGIIGVTQPRRIAALSVSEFIARQMGEEISGTVGYKMRFEDKTSGATKIKIMTDGILLQEMKLDPYLSRYGCLVVDEAHERSLNIDFILGLLKRVLETRRDFKVIISSATINAEVFSEYFGQCPVVKIDAITFPVTLIYDPPAIIESQGSPSSNLEAQEARLKKIASIIERVVLEKRQGDVLVFLPGEKMIRDCMTGLASCAAGKSLHLLPLYGRLGKDEQERVFEDAPRGKIKVVISTNIAETSVTIDGITSVIDCGQAKLNYYNTRTFTSSLLEVPISKASANQRKGRAGRTQPGTCYRLYQRRDFENRPLFTVEEIFRTDLSEVVLRMADLGITTFEDFDFISPPSRDGLIAAIETLNLLDALEADRGLSKIGKMMTAFPLPPRQSRIIVEAIMRYPNVVQETIIAAAFLSTQSPYVLPPGEELDARRAHHGFRDKSGDFVSCLKLYKAYTSALDKRKFCDKNYLDERAMAEIHNVSLQLEETVSGLGVPILSGGSVEDYLCSVGRGLIQFVCVREKSGRGSYRSLTADKIVIHPGSVMFKSDPEYIVAGEIVRTSRMYAMSVSPLSKTALEKISAELFEALAYTPVEKQKAPDRAGLPVKNKKTRDFTNHIKIADEVFEIETVKGRKSVRLPWERLAKIKDRAPSATLYKGLKGTVILDGKYTLLAGEKLKLILSLSPFLELDGAERRDWPRKARFNSRKNIKALVDVLPLILKSALWKQNKKELGFLCLITDGCENYWFTCSRGFHTSLNESLASLEALIDELGGDVDVDTRHIVNQTYRRLSDYTNELS